MAERTSSRRHALALAIVAWAIVALGPGEAAAQEADALRMGIKLGVESDSNANRVEGPITDSDVLSRYFFKLDANHFVGRTQSLSTKVRSGGKLYRTVTRENTLLNQADLRYTLRPLAELEQDWLYLFAAGSLKDRSERESHRDYLSLDGRGGLGVILGPVSLNGSLGYRNFAYKPDPGLSSFGPAYGGSARWSITDNFILSAGVNLQLRRFDSTRFTVRDNGDVVQTIGADNLREDRSTSWFADFQYRGDLGVVQLTGTLSDNRSNSYGQSLQRLGGLLTATVPLPFELLFNARFGIQRTIYSDEIFIDPTVVIDEDNRYSLVAALALPLTELVDVELKYSLYTQEFGLASADYLRQLVFAGVGFEID